MPSHPMRTMSERTAAEIASDIHSWSQDAVWDVAACVNEYEDPYGGARDSDADGIFNDPDQMSDLLGDRIYDDTRGKKEFFNEVVDELAKLMRHLPKSMWDALKMK